MCAQLVFSSSATVYGQPEKIPCVEDFELTALNPYGRTKVAHYWIRHLIVKYLLAVCNRIMLNFFMDGSQLFPEMMAQDIQKADPEWQIVILRYFNPIGAHVSGRLGEDPKGIPNNLMPYVQQVAVGRLPHLNVHGNDYPTRDGTAVLSLSCHCFRI